MRRVLAIAMMLVCLRAARASGLAETTAEHWYALQLQGQPAGWAHEVQRTEGDRVITESDTTLKIGQGGMNIELQIRSRFVETPDGEPIEMWCLQRLGAEPTEVTYRFVDDGVIVESGGRETRKPRPEGDWLTPARAREELARRIREGEDRIVLRVLDPTVGLDPVELTRTIEERDVPVTTPEGRFEAVRTRVTQSYQPGVVSEEFLDRDGALVRGELRFGALTLTTERSRRAKDDAPAHGPEVLASTLIHPDRPIRDPRRTTRAVYELSMSEGDLPDFPTAGGQTFERLDAGRGRVTVTVDGGPVMAGEADDPAFLASGGAVESDDDLVAQLTERALRGVDESLRARAEALHRFVHRHVRRKALGVGFAGAGEVARTRQGDCTEHAVLLAAMLRAAGIPARVASGLIYADRFAGADDVFGYHMWAQALVDGRWIDLDATLPQPFDATHITIWVSALEDGSLAQDSAALAPLMGRLKVRVVEIQR